jgi:hypothetical protein
MNTFTRHLSRCDLSRHPQLATLGALDAALHAADHAVAAAHPTLHDIARCCTSFRRTEHDAAAEDIVLAIRALRAHLRRYDKLSAFVRAALDMRDDGPRRDDDEDDIPF